MNEEMIGMSLDGFTVEEIFEAWSDYEDRRSGRKPGEGRIGFFRSRSIAKGIAANRQSYLGRVTKHLMITNGSEHYLFSAEPIELDSDEEAAQEVREAALKKLSDSELRVLGL